MTETEQQGGKLIPLRAIEASAVSVDEPRPGEAAYADTTGTSKKRQDIISEPFTRARLPETLGNWLGKTSYQARFHGIRLPLYVPRLTWLAIRGTGVLSGRLSAWWGAADLRLLESQAVAAGRAGHGEAMRAHTEGKKTRGTRGRIVGVTAAVAVFALLALWRFAPHFVFIPLLAAPRAGCWFATAGRKASRCSTRPSSPMSSPSRPRRSSPARSRPSASTRSAGGSRSTGRWSGCRTCTATATAGVST